jgi:hypothetical protein
LPGRENGGLSFVIWLSRGPGQVTEAVAPRLRRLSLPTLRYLIFDVDQPDIELYRRIQPLVQINAEVSADYALG